MSFSKTITAADPSLNWSFDQRPGPKADNIAKKGCANTSHPAT
jgi:hypothetical protein